MNTEAHITLRITLGTEATAQYEHPSEYYHYATVLSATTVSKEIPPAFLQACISGAIDTEDVDINQVVPEALKEILTTPQEDTETPEKELRNSIVGDLWNEEQRAFEARNPSARNTSTSPVSLTDSSGPETS